MLLKIKVYFSNNETKYLKEIKLYIALKNKSTFYKKIHYTFKNIYICIF